MRSKPSFLSPAVAPMLIRKSSGRMDLGSTLGNDRYKWTFIDSQLIGPRGAMWRKRGAREDEMDVRRKSIRQRSSLRGRIYFNDGRPSVSCLIHDISYEGARIVILDSIDIPNEIKLCIPEKNRIMHANVRWRHDDKIGLAFSEGVPHISGPPRNIHHAPTPR